MRALILPHHGERSTRWPCDDPGTPWWPLRLTSSIASLWCLKKLQERTDRLTVQLMNHRGRQRATRCSSYLLSDKHHRPRIHSPKPSVDGLRSWLPVMFQDLIRKHKMSMRWRIVKRRLQTLPTKVLSNLKPSTFQIFTVWSDDAVARYLQTNPRMSHGTQEDTMIHWKNHEK